MLTTRTFLFSDLRDYTRFVETHGDEAARTLIEDYRRIVRAEIGKHEGAEIKTEGDSFYVVFTNARAAMACGTGLLRDADRYSAEHASRPMRIGVGIHAGEPLPHEGQYVGSAVIVAARLAQSAKAGELLITDLVRGLLPRQGLPQLEERTDLALKGIEEQPRIFAVLWQAAAAPRAASMPEVVIEAAAPTSQQILCPIVVGRERERAALDAALADALAGRARTVLVSGEAGLGKSALLRDFAAHVKASGARMLVGECNEIEARRPFGPFIDAFIAAGIDLPTELSQGGPGAQLVAEAERYRVHSAFAERLVLASRQAPLVVAIEDLHWADEATYELIPYLARKLKDARVLLLATYRSDELHRLHPLNHVLAELTRGRLAEDVRLHKLTLEETGNVMRGALGLDRQPTTEFRHALWDRTEGNPFFIEEILRALVEKGDLKYRDGAWRRTKDVADLAIPLSVRDAVQQRLLTLDPNARKVVQVAAVIGQRFEFDLLQEVSGLDESTVLAGIKAAIDEQLVREDADADADEERYAFRHALSRESVLAEMLQRERRLLHRAVGEAIERNAGGALGARAEELAYHFDQARDARAFRYHELAATEAARMFGFPRAVHHLERAIELAADDEPRIGELQLRLADQAFWANDIVRSLRAAEQARATFDHSGDDHGAGEAIQRASLAHWYLGETEKARAMIDEAIGRLEPLGDSAALARCYGEASRLAMLDNREDDAVVLGERALEMAKRHGALDVEVSAYATIGTSLGHQRLDEGLPLLRKSLALAVEHGMQSHAHRAYNNLVATLVRGPDYAEPARIHAESVAYADRWGVRPDVLIARDLLFRVDAGEWDEALADHAAMTPDTIWWYGRLVWTTFIRVARDGPSEPLFAEMERARARLLAAGDTQWVGEAARPALAYLLAGRYAEARDVAAAGSEAMRRTGYGFQTRLGTALVVAALARGDDATVDLWSRAMLDWPDAGWAAPTGEAFARAALARRAGDAAGAIRLFREAADLAARQPPFQHQTHTSARLAIAEQLANEGHPEEARAELDRALPPWRRAKAAWYLAELERWAAAQGIPTARG
ncbi:MAG TPA: AAA family ATPase [Candidatus Limnocylindria bacterium]|nr:AAA family ATPase [Candidatus Limnocylindria bacterium]